MSDNPANGSVRITIIAWRSHLWVVDEEIYLGEFGADPTSLLCRTSLTKLGNHIKVVTTFLGRDAEQARATHRNVIEGALKDSKHWT